MTMRSCSSPQAAVLIRTRISEIRDMGRATQGVRLINLGGGEKLAGLEKILEPDEAEEE